MWNWVKWRILRTHRDSIMLSRNRRCGREIGKNPTQTEGRINNLSWKLIVDQALWHRLSPWTPTLVLWVDINIPLLWMSKLKLWKLRSSAPRDKAEIQSSQIHTRISLSPQSTPSFTKVTMVTEAPRNAHRRALRKQSWQKVLLTPSPQAPRFYQCFQSTSWNRWRRNRNPVQR